MSHNRQGQNRIDMSGISAALYTLFLPLNHNNGRLMQAGRLNWVQREILRYTGGLTRFPPGTGYWVDHTAKIFRDQVMPIQVVTSADPEVEAWFAHQAAEMAVVLQQQQIFLFAQPIWRLEPPSNSVYTLESPYKWFGNSLRHWPEF